MKGSDGFFIKEWPTDLSGNGHDGGDGFQIGPRHSIVIAGEFDDLPIGETEWIFQSETVSFGVFNDMGRLRIRSVVGALDTVVSGTLAPAGPAHIFAHSCDDRLHQFCDGEAGNSFNITPPDYEAPVTVSARRPLFVVNAVLALADIGRVRSLFLR
ncbi:hypothetical protein [Mameliella sp.]|uniref:hypothetical protein n=1 Tax=Mameliella sp. TaxID=1924940 RepID=UPI003BA949F1